MKDFRSVSAGSSRPDWKHGQVSEQSARGDSMPDLKGFVEHPMESGRLERSFVKMTPSAAGNKSVSPSHAA